MSKPRILLAGVALFVTLICWSLSSPINSHQDEKFHLASIWCADGFDENCEYQGLSETGVDTVLIDANLCTPANAEETENKRLLIHRDLDDCKFEATKNEPLTKLTTSPDFFYETNTQIAAWIQPGHTPTVYYKTLNIFDIDNKEQSVIRFRIFNSLLFILLLIAFLLVSDQIIRDSALFGLLATFIPHGLFLVSGVTNSSWSYAGCSLSWGFLYALLNQPFRINWKTGLTTLGWVISSGIVIFSRYDATVLLFFSNLTVLALYFHTRTTHRKTFLLVFSIASLITARLVWQSLPKIQSLAQAPNTPPLNLRDLLINFGTAIKLVFATLLRILGLQAPGWGPLSASLVVFWFNLLFFVATITLLLSAVKKIKSILLFLNLIVLLGIFLVQISIRPDWTTPFYLIRTSWSGDVFSPRYFIPYFPFLFGILAVTSKNFTAVLSNLNFRNSLFTVLAFTQTITLHDIGRTFRENPDWYWQNLNIGVQSVFVIGTISFTAFLYFLLIPSSNMQQIEAL